MIQKEHKMQKNKILFQKTKKYFVFIHAIKSSKVFQAYFLKNKNHNIFIMLSKSVFKSVIMVVF